MLLKLRRYLAGDDSQEIREQVSPRDPDEPVNTIHPHRDLLHVHVEPLCAAAEAGRRMKSVRRPFSPKSGLLPVTGTPADGLRCRSERCSVRELRAGTHGRRGTGGDQVVGLANAGGVRTVAMRACD